ncbi:MAG: LPS assembly protein LptD [Verrucomicrobiia bacterium]
MTRSSAIARLAFLFAVFLSVVPVRAQPSLVVQALNQIIPSAPAGNVDFTGDKAYGTNVFMQYSNITLIADSAIFDYQTGEVTADGHVRIEEGDQIWVGEHIRYNYKTHQMQSEQFRTGKPPAFAQGQQLQGDITNQTYNARHAYVTTDDVSQPEFYVRSSHIKIVPGKYIEMWNAVFYMNGVPAFYFPYYRHELGPYANDWNFVPGYRTAYGAFLLNTYTWHFNEAVDGKFHLDYRSTRGVGLGPDLNLHLGQWGDAALKYYYLNDQNPNTSTNGTPWTNGIPNTRQRYYLGYQGTPATNLNLKALVNYQTDPLVEHDFFGGDYANNPQPNTFIEINKYGRNWSLDALTTPQLNNFFDQVERLPEVKLTGYRQQLLGTPVYYESESSAGYYHMYFASTNGGTPPPPGYSASRADTFHQLLLPETFFGWLSVVPRAGGRFTYYSTETGAGSTNGEAGRGVFNTSVTTSFKASQLWTGATNSALAINGLRHIIEPSVTYAYVPTPNKTPAQLPQFDSALPSLELLPVQFPDYNNIDSIDSENVVRFGLRNTLQTRRDGQLDNLIDWKVMLDWRLTPGENPNNLDEPFSPQQNFSDLYSDFAFKPRTWIVFDSQSRYDLNGGTLNLAFDQLTFTPNDRWSWGFGYWYLRSGFDGFTQANNFITSTFFYRFNDNWGLRMRHEYNAADGQLQEQNYTIYRDLRSWTGALTFRVIDNSTGPTDYTVAFTFSIKARPKVHVGDDTVEPNHLVGE